jgi:hypothetical protein
MNPKIHGIWNRKAVGALALGVLLSGAPLLAQQDQQSQPAQPDQSAPPAQQDQQGQPAPPSQQDQPMQQQQPRINSRSRVNRLDRKIKRRHQFKRIPLHLLRNVP